MFFQRAVMAVTLALVVAGAARGQDIRLANGMPVPGTLVQAKPEGLEISTPTGPRVLTWETLSAGTRFRLQESYRITFSNILEGASVAERAALYEARKAAPAPEPAPEPKKKTRKKKAAE
ncbi:MAG TPA: hypothetical protein P5567_08850 [Kiritimatiellia bacterium]|nr:hypothetical protein [Kiritimatiellia bacterium]HRZ12549.1 hypothetical protein [Kiritimatiellia bacterium]HSA17627.1 hypothetical protein [Kiritimatiellia bacterium]